MNPWPLDEQPGVKVSVEFASAPATGGFKDNDRPATAKEVRCNTSAALYKHVQSLKKNDY